MVTQPGERSYYIDDYSDEVVPCDCSLQGWAEWLAQPDKAWRRPAPAKDGSRWSADVLEWQDDIIATLVDGEWIFSRPFSGLDFVAMRFGPGTGWEADNICAPDEDSVREMLSDSDEIGGHQVHFAVGINAPPVVLIFHAGPPPQMEVEGVVQ